MGRLPNYSCPMLLETYLDCLSVMYYFWPPQTRTQFAVLLFHINDSQKFVCFTFDNQTVIFDMAERYAAKCILEAWPETELIKLRINKSKIWH